MTFVFIKVTLIVAFGILVSLLRAVALKRKKVVPSGNKNEQKSENKSRLKWAIHVLVLFAVFFVCDFANDFEIAGKYYEADLLFFYAFDILSWCNPILLLFTSSNVRNLLSRQ
jgi:hypothetical protein